MGYWFMSLNKFTVLLLVLPLCAFSFAAGGLTHWLAGNAERGGREVYRIAGQVYTERALLDELQATISLHPGIKPGDYAVIQESSSFRAAFLRNRYTGDVLVALAEKQGLLSTPEAEAWLRIALREAVRQLCMARMTGHVSVSSNEVSEFYDAHAAALAHLSFTDALAWVEERLLQQKQQEALLSIVQEAEKTLPAHSSITNF
jgi:hypothetical protein